MSDAFEIALEYEGEDYPTINYREVVPRVCGWCKHQRHDGGGSSLCLHPKHPFTIGDSCDGMEWRRSCKDYKKYG